MYRSCSLITGNSSWCSWVIMNNIKLRYTTFSVCFHRHLVLTQTYWTYRKKEVNSWLSCDILHGIWSLNSIVSGSFKWHFYPKRLTVQLLHSHSPMSHLWFVEIYNGDIVNDCSVLTSNLCLKLINHISS